MPSSSSARITRTAISPRLATRTLVNMRRGMLLGSARMERRFLVTGSGGCIGAWTVAQVVDGAAPVVAFGASPADHRLKLVLSEDELAALEGVTGDITDLEGLERTLDEHGI